MSGTTWLRRQVCSADHILIFTCVLVWCQVPPGWDVRCVVLIILSFSCVLVWCQVPPGWDVRCAVSVRGLWEGVHHRHGSEEAPPDLPFRCAALQVFHLLQDLPHALHGQGPREVTHRSAGLLSQVDVGVCLYKIQTMCVCWLIALTSQQHASESQGWICSDKFMCCLTEIEVADPSFYLTQSKYTDTGWPVPVLTL